MASEGKVFYLGNMCISLFIQATHRFSTRHLFKKLPLSILGNVKIGRLGQWKDFSPQIPPPASLGLESGLSLKSDWSLKNKIFV